MFRFKKHPPEKEISKKEIGDKLKLALIETCRRMNGDKIDGIARHRPEVYRTIDLRKG